MNDPYEEQFVYVKQSTIPGAGEVRVQNLCFGQPWAVGWNSQHVVGGGGGVVCCCGDLSIHDT